MQDLLLDNPDGCRVLAQFLARAVVDEVRAQGLANTHSHCFIARGTKTLDDSTRPREPRVEEFGLVVMQPIAVFEQATAPPAAPRAPAAGPLPCSARACAAGPPSRSAPRR